MLPERRDNILNNSHGLSCGTADIALLYSLIRPSGLIPGATHADFSACGVHKSVQRVHFQPALYTIRSNPAAKSAIRSSTFSKPICSRIRVPLKSTSPPGRRAAICSGWLARSGIQNRPRIGHAEEAKIIQIACQLVIIQPFFQHKREQTAAARKVTLPEFMPLLPGSAGWFTRSTCGC